MRAIVEIIRDGADVATALRHYEATAKVKR
jgi:hypothetical protein